MLITNWTQYVYDCSIQRCISGYKQEVSHWSGQQWFNATGGEIGELSNVVKKMNRHVNNYAGNDKTATLADYRLYLIDEVADVYLYLVLCQASLAEYNANFLDLSNISMTAALDAFPESYGQGRKNLLNMEFQVSELMIVNGKCLEIILVGEEQMKADIMREHMKHITEALVKLSRMAQFDIKEAVKDKFNKTSVKINSKVRI